MENGKRDIKFSRTVRNSDMKGEIKFRTFYKTLKYIKNVSYTCQFF